MRINSFTVLLATTLGIISCKDDDPTLPAMTSSGANTFGCRIDNRIYVPGNGQAGTRAEILNDRIIVYGGADYVSISLQVIDSIQPIATNKPYYFTDVRGINCEYVTGSSISSCAYSDAPISGAVTFTKIDRINRILSGTFEFSAFSKECNKSAAITDGRFDIRLDH